LSRDFAVYVVTYDNPRLPFLENENDEGNANHFTEQLQILSKSVYKNAYVGMHQAFPTKKVFLLLVTLVTLQKK
jgi:hypothetical protein